jgi:hypothetical protein
MPGAFRFPSNEDRECYRKGIRILALMYVGILVLVAVVTALRAELRTEGDTAKATAGVVLATAPEGVGVLPAQLDLSNQN